MELNDTRLELLCNAWLLAPMGIGMVVTDDAFVDAHYLAEHGWLKRRVEADGQVSWWWSERADAAFDLTQLAAAHQNPN